MFEFLPLRADPAARQVTVTSKVHSDSGKIIPVKYSMHLTGKGWKVYDVAVDGVSMITTYRTSFATEIKQKGLDGLIRSLAERNARLLKGTALTSN
jgi:phospholipid transport system substrate-binding protein